MALIRETYLAQDLEGKLLLSMLNLTHHLLHQNTTITNSFLAQLVEQNAISTRKTYHNKSLNSSFCNVLYTSKAKVKSEDFQNFDVNQDVL